MSDTPQAGAAGANGKAADEPGAEDKKKRKPNLRSVWAEARGIVWESRGRLLPGSC